MVRLHLYYSDQYYIYFTYCQEYDYIKCIILDTIHYYCYEQYLEMDSFLINNNIPSIELIESINLSKLFVLTFQKFQYFSRSQSIIIQQKYDYNSKKNTLDQFLSVTFHLPLLHKSLIQTISYQVNYPKKIELCESIFTSPNSLSHYTYSTNAYTIYFTYCPILDHLSINIVNFKSNECYTVQNDVIQTCILQSILQFYKSIRISKCYFKSKTKTKSQTKYLHVKYQENKTKAHIMIPLVMHPNYI